jgi:hypothetical protein
MAKRTKHPVEYGYVVQICERRAGTRKPYFYCDYARAPKDFARAVGMSSLEYAEFFTDRRDAASCAFWQLGEVKFATRSNGVIKI